MRPIKLAILGSITIVVLSSCGSAVKGDAPEPTPDNIINGTNTQVIRMPDGFRNVAFTCHNTTGIYVTSRGWVQSSVDSNIVPLPSSVTAIPDHPMCIIP